MATGFRVLLNTQYSQHLTDTDGANRRRNRMLRASKPEEATGLLESGSSTRARSSMHDESARATPGMAPSEQQSRRPSDAREQREYHLDAVDEDSSAARAESPPHSLFAPPPPSGSQAPAQGVSEVAQATGSLTSIPQQGIAQPSSTLTDSTQMSIQPTPSQPTPAPPTPALALSTPPPNHLGTLLPSRSFDFSFDAVNALRSIEPEPLRPEPDRLIAVDVSAVAHSTAVAARAALERQQAEAARPAPVAREPEEPSFATDFAVVWDPATATAAPVGYYAPESFVRRERAATTQERPSGWVGNGVSSSNASSGAQGSNRHSYYDNTMQQGSQSDGASRRLPASGPAPRPLQTGPRQSTGRNPYRPTSGQSSIHSPTSNYGFSPTSAHNYPQARQVQSSHNSQQRHPRSNAAPLTIVPPPPQNSRQIRSPGASSAGSPCYPNLRDDRWGQPRGP